MLVTVQLFAAARDRMGLSRIEVVVGQDATVAELRERISVGFPQLAGIVRQAMVAVDTEYARNDQHIEATSEIALIPPVSGG